MSRYIYIYICLSMYSKLWQSLGPNNNKVTCGDDFVSGILSAYSDNASVIEGPSTVRLLVDGETKEYVPVCAYITLDL